MEILFACPITCPYAWLVRSYIWLTHQIVKCAQRWKDQIYQGWNTLSLKRNTPWKVACLWVTGEANEFMVRLFWEWVYWKCNSNNTSRRKIHVRHRQIKCNRHICILNTQTFYWLWLNFHGQFFPGVYHPQDPRKIRLQKFIRST